MAIRRRLDPEQSRTMILDAVERLIRREGCSAISTRRVAAEAGLKAPLVHYYYATLDDLLLAFYRRSAEQTRKRLAEALASDRPLWALWEKIYTDPERSYLSAEFLALANHRTSIRDEIARQIEAFRDMQAAALASALRNTDLARDIGSPEAAAVLLGGIARALATEERIGITKGHADVRAFVEHYIQRVEGNSEPSSDA